MSRCHRREPGIAPSRLKAKVIRDALVMQAVVQKNWPMARTSYLAALAVGNAAYVSVSSA